MSGGVFICYRREETAFAARAIHDRVVQRLERENVFLDVDNIDLGVDWFNVLTERVGACDALVAVIGRNWVSSADKDGLRRIDDPDDFVRIEIEAALHRNVRVIPVLVDGAAMPKAGELPESLKGLARRQGTEVSPARFEADVEKLTRALITILDDRRLRDATEAEAARRAEEDRRAQEVADAKRVAREDREQQEVAEAARAEEARRVAEAERVARVERERLEAAEAAERVAEARRPEEAEAAREPKDANNGFQLFSGTSAIRATSAARPAPVRTYSHAIAVAIAIGIAAALAILFATFGSPAWKFSAPAGDKVAEQATADKAAADKAAADKAAADKAAADKAAADKAAADKAAADKAAVDRASAQAAVSTASLTPQAVAPPDSSATPTSPQEQYLMGENYYYGHNGVNRDYQQAMVWYRKAADQGDRAAQIMLGSLYQDGLGVSKDRNQAKSWYQKAADQGSPLAQDALKRLRVSDPPATLIPPATPSALTTPQEQYERGDAYYWGRAGVNQDYQQAFYWYQKAADQGDPAAQIMLGSLYENGLGVRKDYDRARSWYQKAADQGRPLAQDALKRLTGK